MKPAKKQNKGVRAAPEALLAMREEFMALAEAYGACGEYNAAMRARQTAIDLLRWSEEVGLQEVAWPVTIHRSGMGEVRLVRAPASVATA